MEIISFRKIEGPNVYHAKPVLIMRLNLKEWAEVGSHETPGLKEKLLTLLPGLNEHFCSVGHQGGFIERLERGTYMAHIVEHVALELSCRAGLQVSFGKARFAGKTGLYDVITRFKSEESMKECLRQSVSLVEACLREQTYNIRLGLESILQKKDQGELGPTSLALAEAAQRRNIPIRRLSEETSLLQLGYGKNRRLLQTSMTDQTSVIGTDLVQDKQMTKTLLDRYGVPVPKGKIVSRLEELQEVFVEMPGPFVLKPLDGHHGEGVSLNLHTLSELELSFQRAQKASKNGLVLMEEMCEGSDYRLLVVNGKFIAAARRSPPTVVGDGLSTIESLIESLNQDPRRGDGHESLLTKVEIDESVLQHLHKSGRSLHTVPQKSECVTLLGTANLSKGGTASDVTDDVHPETRRLCERISRLVQLDVCGIDLIHDDIRNPPSGRLKVIEVNAAPGLRMHLSPCSGKSRNVADPIVDMLYPNQKPSRIPIIAITGTNGKTTVARLMKKILSDSQLQVGLTTTEGIWIGDQKIVSGDTTGPRSAETVLADSSVETAVLEVARGGILRGGLAYDWSDVGIVLNVRPDHLGQDGLETLDDIVWVKSLVAERVREGGTLILNADDPASVQMKDLPNVRKLSRNIFLYSRFPNQKDFQEHISKGGSGCWTDSDWVYLQHGSSVKTAMALQEIPLTVHGTVEHQVSNVLAAISGAVSLGVDLSSLRTSLRTFKAADNLGRLSLYKIHDSFVLLDYAHNPDALQAIGQFLKRWEIGETVCVVGLPGDRSDDLLQESARALRDSFQNFILRDDEDLRGRAPLEVPRMIEKIIREASKTAKIQFQPDCRAAVELAISQLKPGSFVVIFYDDLDSTLASLRHYDPVPVEDWPFKLRRTESQTSRPKVWKQGNPPSSPPEATL